MIMEDKITIDFWEVFWEWTSIGQMTAISATGYSGVEQKDWEFKFSFQQHGKTLPQGRCFLSIQYTYSIKLTKCL